jgi:hypothetical protein
MNGWIRLGIVLSVVWAIAVFFYVRNIDFNRASAFLDERYSSCVKVMHAEIDRLPLGSDLDVAVGKEYSDCVDSAMNHMFDKDRGPGYAALAALAPIPFIWLIGWLVFLVIRWVVRGFKARLL